MAAAALTRQAGLPDVYGKFATPNVELSIAVQVSDVRVRVNTKAV